MFYKINIFLKVIFLSQVTVIRALFLILSFSVFSCGGPYHIDYFPIDDEGQVKPKVVLVPLIDSSEHELSWDVADELAKNIDEELKSLGECYVPYGKEVGVIWNKRYEIDFFSSDLSYAKEFKQTDYIVALELIEHSLSAIQSMELLSKKRKDSFLANQLITSRVRIKVIDIRYETPKIILYEVFKSCYKFTPSKNTELDLKVCLNEEGYNKTPYGIAHKRLAKNLAARLAKVIWMDK